MIVSSDGQGYLTLVGWFLGQFKELPKYLSFLTTSLRSEGKLSLRNAHHTLTSLCLNLLQPPGITLESF